MNAVTKAVGHSLAEPQIGFMYNCGRLEGVIGAFALEIGLRHPSKFLVESRHKELGRLPLERTGLPGSMIVRHGSPERRHAAITLSEQAGYMLGIVRNPERTIKPEVSASMARFERARTLFYQALDLPEPEQAPFLHQACGADRALLQEVEELLAYHGRSGDLLDAVDALGSAVGPGTVHPERIGLYHVSRLIGHGGMGIVYEAAAPDGTTVAIKVLRGALMTPEARMRFRREVQVLQALAHPSIPRFVDAGLDRRHGEELPYLVMEYVDGVILTDHLLATAPVPAARAELIASIAEAIHHAHLQGVIHRDLKPSNILVTIDGDGAPRPKVIDFGVAKLTAINAAGTTFRTRSGALLGTIGYMSPEHLSAEALTARSDVYCLGVIAYEVFAGKLPYDLPGDSVMRTVLAILNVPALPLPRDAAPREVDQVLQRAMEKQPTDRHASAREFADDLRRAARGDRSALRPGTIARRWRRSARRFSRGWAAGIAILTLTAVTLGGISLARSRAEERSVDRRLRSLYLEIDEIDTIRHGTGLTQHQMRSCIARLERADSILTTLPHRPFYTDISAYITFRRGELLYFIGQENRDRDTLTLASLTWHRVWGMKRQQGAMAGMKGHEALALRIAALPAKSGQGHDALVHRFLGRMDSPRFEYGWERHRSLGALEDLLRMGENAYFFVPSRNLGNERSARDRIHQDLASAHFNAGIALTNLGVTVDSLAAIESALRYFAIADTSDVFRQNSDRSLYNRCRGRAFLARAELTRSPADLDSALVCFLSARNSKGDPDQSLAVRSALSECHRLQASFSSADEDRGIHLDQGLRIWRTAHGRSRLAEDPYIVAGAFIEEATLRAEAAVSKRDPSSARELEQASACLDSASVLLRPNREPAFYAKYLLARARVERVRWRLTGDPAAREAAESDLEESSILLPIDESRRHARMIRAELDALGVI